MVRNMQISMKKLKDFQQTLLCETEVGLCVVLIDSFVQYSLNAMHY